MEEVEVVATHPESHPGCCYDHTLPHLVALGGVVERPGRAPHVEVTQWVTHHLYKEDTDQDGNVDIN